jgi:hypothetical protein
VKKRISFEEFKRLSVFMSQNLINQRYQIDTENNEKDEPNEDEEKSPISEMVFIRGVLAKEVPLNLLDPRLSGIYLIRNPEGQVIYVGQSQGLLERLTNHEHFYEGCLFEIAKFDDCESLEQRLFHETFFINKYLEQGHPLLNKCHVVKNFKRT